MKIPVRHRSKSAAFKALVLTTLFSLSIQPAAAASTIGVNDTASTVSVSERETLADSHLFQEDQAIEIDGEIGLTPAEVKSDGVVFLPFVETSSVMASGTGTCLVL